MVDRVPTEAKQLKRHNHTVNKSYLRRFADVSGLLTGIALPGDRSFQISIEKATVMNSFYVEQLPDGSETDKAEDEFCDLEGEAAAAIKSLIDDRAWPIRGVTRRAIAEWAAMQYLRVPWVRALAREINTAATEVGIRVRTADGESTTLRLPPDDAARTDMKAIHLAFIRREIPVVAEMLYQRAWDLTFFSRKALATSDSPVVLRPMLKYPSGTTVAIGEAAEVQVPLDRRVALSMVIRSTEDRRIRGVTKKATELNQATASNARRFLFYHPSDEPLKGLTLPNRRRRETTSPEAAAALVEDLVEWPTLIEGQRRPSLARPQRSAATSRPSPPGSTRPTTRESSKATSPGSFCRISTRRPSRRVRGTALGPR